MRTAYEIGRDGYWTGESVERGKGEGAPAGYTFSPLPDLADGEYARWAGLSWVASNEAPPEPVIPRADVDAEADRRRRAGFTFRGKPFDYDQKAQDRITGTYSIATNKKADGAEAGDLRWFDADNDFVWITADNDTMSLDVFGMIGLGETAAKWESAHVFAANGIKRMDPIPADFTDDKYWP